MKYFEFLVGILACLIVILLILLCICGIKAVIEELFDL